MNEKNQTPLRTLEQIIGEIHELVIKPGYLYALLMVTVKDLCVPLDQLIKVNWFERLSGNEVQFLFGLLIKRPFDLEIPPSIDAVTEYIVKSRQLLEELHKYYGIRAMNAMIDHGLQLKEQGKPIPTSPPIFSSPESIIECTFYSDSGAYDFQYWELAPARYKNDEVWIQSHAGFSIDDAVMLAKAIKKIFELKVNALPDKLGNFYDFCKGVLDCFSFRFSDVKMKETIYEKIIERFSIVPGNVNQSFNAPSDSNDLGIKPIIKLPDGSCVLPISFDFAKSIDESPFYWMKDANDQFIPEAVKNRGDFTEEICHKLLTKVFGRERTYKDVKILRKKGEGIKKKGEDFTDIDILALKGNKVIVVQAKSKKLTQLSRHGDLNKFVSDFQEAVQEAYTQGIEARRHILKQDAVFLDSTGNPIVFDQAINKVYIINVTTDNYPSIQIQAHALLQRELNDPWPLSINIFDLDLLTYYLADPYEFLFYINQRTHLADKIDAPTEIAALGFHLTQKLYMDKTSKYDRIHIVEDFAQLIDEDIIQRYGAREEARPSRISQKWKNENFSKISSEIKALDIPFLTDAIFFLYSLSSDLANKLIDCIQSARSKCRFDHQPHNFSLLTKSGCGLTYVVVDRSKDLQKYIVDHSTARKYLKKSDLWLGLGSYFDSNNFVDSIVFLNEPWVQDSRLETFSKELIPFTGQITKSKIGRNDPCYCGSGKKYKKCCY